MIDDSLFSIDTAAHLRKMAASTFRQPAFYPVELVRTALRRGAKRVDIRSRRGLLEMDDDGAAIPEQELDALERIFTPGTNPGEREAAIDSFSGATGIGLLALFALPAERFEVESGTADARRKLIVSSGELIVSSGELIVGPASSIGPQTSLRIASTGRNWKAEQEALRLHCRFTTSAVYLNGERIGAGLTLPDAMASLRIMRDGQAAGIVGIPAADPVCRLWLLENGICWNWRTLTARSGLVWVAAVEAETEPGEAELTALDDVAHRLYVWLAGHGPALPPPLPDRVEKRLFDRLRKVEDQVLQAAYRPFRLDDRTVSLTELIRRAGEKRLSYCLAGEEMEPVGGEVQLTRQQADYLLNELKLPLCRLRPVPVDSGWAIRIGRFRDAVAGKLRRLLPRSGSAICREDELKPEHRRFLELAGARLPSVSCRMGKGRWGEPVLVLPAGGPPELFLFRRRHRLVKQAIRAVAMDPMALEIALAAMLPESRFRVGENIQNCE
jgi:hypothetical protein